MNIRKMTRPLALLSLLGAAVLYSGLANAAMISYYLDQTNIDQGSLTDGINYATVAIDDNTAGEITFTVTPLSPLTSIASTNFGLQSFDFNISGSNLPSDSSSAPAEWMLPLSWTANVAPPPNQADGFGQFNVEVADGGSSRQDPLIFHISTTTGLTINDFAALSTGNTGQGNVYFAAHIAGLNGPGNGNNQVTSGYFGGSTLAAVPLPAAGWLLLSALAVLGVMEIVSRRKPGSSQACQFA